MGNTINDKQWKKIQAGARRTEKREGGMFGKKPTDRRKIASANKKNAGKN